MPFRTAYASKKSSRLRNFSPILLVLVILGCPTLGGPIGPDEARYIACVVQWPESTRIVALHGTPDTTPNVAAAGPRIDTDWIASGQKAWADAQQNIGYLVHFQPGEQIGESGIVIAPSPGFTRGSEGGRIFRDNVVRVAAILTASGVLGSGILVEPNILATNFHVVGGETEVNVHFQLGDAGALREEDAIKGTVISALPRKDLALVQIEGQESRAHATLGELTSVDVGSEVYAIGHPSGLLWSFTSGVVSQIRRDYDGSYNLFNSHEATVIQTQTPINPGNSGGPLFNPLGEVVGINTFGHPSRPGLNFAVSVSEIAALLAKRPAPPPAKLEPTKKDLDGNGRIDTLEFDRDLAGGGDLWMYDFDGDESIEALSLDVDYSHAFPDVFLFDGNGDGKPSYYHVDENNDGMIDRVLVDSDGDGNPDAQVEC